MSTDFANVAELRDFLGGVPLERIRLDPPPGTATEADLLHVLDHENRTCELIDGVLVEKTMGAYESRLAIALAHLLESFLDEHDLGIVLGADGTLRILPEQVRVPDVSFLSWDSLPDRRLPRDTPVPAVVPDLAVEILSQGNTKAEMDRKLRDYFEAGVRLVWLIDPPTRTANVFVSPDESEQISARGSLDGGEVLPGFQLPLAKLFARAERSGGNP